MSRIWFIFMFPLAVCKSPAERLHESATMSLQRTFEFRRSLEFAQAINFDPLLLDEVLYPFKSKYCYAILRNFFNLDFVQTSIPLLTQYFEAKNVKQPDSQSTTDETGVTWVASIFRAGDNKSTPLESFENKSCGSPMYLNDRYMRYWGYCISLNATKWYNASRLGNCKINIDYFMPDYMVGNRNYSGIFPQFVRFSQRWAASLPEIIILIPLRHYLNITNESSFYNIGLFKCARFSLEEKNSQSDFGTIMQNFLVAVTYGIGNWGCSFPSLNEYYKLDIDGLKIQPVTIQNWTEMARKDLKSLGESVFNVTTTWSLNISWNIGISINHLITAQIMSDYKLGRYQQ